MVKNSLAQIFVGKIIVKISSLFTDEFFTDKVFNNICMLVIGCRKVKEREENPHKKIFAFFLFFFFNDL